MVLTVCVLVGFLAGAQHGESTPTLVPTCPPPATQECTARAAMAGPQHLIFSALGGMLIGTAVGVALALLIPRSRERPYKPSTRTAGMTGGRWITARYKGKCRRCGRTIYPGERVLHFRFDRKVGCRACGWG